MACIGALCKTSLNRSALDFSRFKHYAGQLGRVRVLCGGVLFALLISASTHAIPLRTAEAAPTVLDESINRSSSVLVNDGIHFYGEASDVDVIGSSYLVFASEGEAVVGAIFMPSSSFDCFQGQITQNSLEMQIVNSYTQEAYSYAIAAQNVGAIAANNGGAATGLQLNGFHDMGTPRPAEMAILATCQSNLGITAESEI